MKKQRNDFNNQERFYDLFEDYELIESSFAQQYGIRLRNENDMTWDEFTSLLAGLNEKTALGRIVAIRAESDPKVVKEFSREQKRIRNEWATRKAKASRNKPININEYNQNMKELENLFRAMAT